MIQKILRHRRVLFLGIGTLVFSFIGTIIFTQPTNAWFRHYPLPSTDGTSRQCYAARWEDDGVTYSTKQVCATVDQNGRILKQTMKVGGIEKTTFAVDTIDMPAENDDILIGTNHLPLFQATQSTDKDFIIYASVDPSPVNASWSEQSHQTFNVSYGDENGGKLFEDFAKEVEKIVKDHVSTTGRNFWDGGENPFTGHNEQNDGEPDDPDPVPVPEPSEVQATCANSAGSALGWIICPIVDGASAAAEGAYKNFIKPALQLEPQLFNQNNGGYIAWEVMRNFANIGLVIFLLIIIFSQLTSVGIDNYGIKKALPKIIIAAILINLSFFICQLLVDVSNIVGSSLEMLLRSLGSNIYTQMIPPGETNPHIDIPGGVIALANIGETVGGIAILVAVVSKIGTLIAGSGMALLLPILLVALVVVAAIFFFFALLAIRQAGVLILVVLSPLAFACYMLPNTKSLFDKWKKTFTVLLILYPICGLLVGGGHLVSAILVTSGASGGIGWFIVLTGVIVSVAPFFAIPFLVKSSMQAFGKLGGKLAGLTRTGGKLSNKIKGTQGYQNRFTRMAAGNPNGKLGKFRSKFANSRVGRQTGMQRYYQGAQQAAAGLYEDAVSNGVTGIMAATSGDQSALNEYLTTVLDKTSRKKHLSRQDTIDLEAAFVAAGGKPGNEGKTIAAMERASTNPTQRKAIQNMLNTNSTLGAMVNEHSPMTGRYFSNYVGTGGQNESAYNSTWLSSAEGQKIGKGLKPKHIAKMDADKITEAAKAHAIDAQQMLATLGTSEMLDAQHTAQRDAIRNAILSQHGIQSYTDARNTVHSYDYKNGQWS